MISFGRLCIPGCHIMSAEQFASTHSDSALIDHLLLGTEDSLTRQASELQQPLS